jgi:hypothetical protein
VLQRPRACPEMTFHNPNAPVFLAWRILTSRGVSPLSPRDPVAASLFSLADELNAVEVSGMLDLAVAGFVTIISSSLLGIWLSRIDVGIVFDVGFRCVRTERRLSVKQR